MTARRGVDGAAYGEASDEALVAGIAAGDELAALAFVRRFQRRIFGLAFTVLGDAAAAEDVAQETLVRVWLHAAVFDPRRGSVSGWVLTIARNVAIDARRLGRASPTSPSEIAERLDRVHQRDTSSASEDRMVLADALCAIPAEQRRAVLLASLCGFSAAEIGETESIPLGTAKTRIRSGLLKLRAALSFGEEVP